MAPSQLRSAMEPAGERLSITRRLSDADDHAARDVLAYERDHKDRAGVINAATR